MPFDLGSLILFFRLLIEQILRRDSGETEQNAGVAEDCAGPDAFGRSMQQLEVSFAHFHIDLNGAFFFVLHCFILTLLEHKVMGIMGI
jgi:hypothetical protein